MFETPSYIKALKLPEAKTAKPARARRIWSIDPEAVWLPFFHATNTMGETAISGEALGAPLRLAVGKDGAIRFNQSGMPVIRVVKDISDMVRYIREQFTAGLMSYTNGVATENPDGYTASIRLAVVAGKPIIQHDTALLANALANQAEAEAIAKAEAKPKAHKVKAEAKAKADALADMKAEPVKEPELVTA